MLRVTGGTHRGRVLRTLKGNDCRPTLSRVRQAVFNILGESVVDSRFLDLFAGTGTVGIEALSRGAREAVFVERSHRCRRILEGNLSALKLTDRAEVVTAEALGWLERARGPFDVVFADPPYGTGLAGHTLEILDGLGQAELGFLVIQHRPREVLPENTRNFHRVTSRRYGATAVEFYAPTVRDPSDVDVGRDRLSEGGTP